VELYRDDWVKRNSRCLRRTQKPVGRIGRAGFKVHSTNYRPFRRRYYSARAFQLSLRAVYSLHTVDYTTLEQDHVTESQLT